MADNEKVAVVTGAARGIGREIASELLSMGIKTPVHQIVFWCMIILSTIYRQLQVL